MTTLLEIESKANGMKKGSYCKLLLSSEMSNRNAFGVFNFNLQNHKYAW